MSTAVRTKASAAFRRIRNEINVFKPDVIVMGSADQYGNFREDIIPPYCVLTYAQRAYQPYRRLRGKPHIWNQPADKTFIQRGHQKAGRFLARRRLEKGIDMSYARKPQHEDGLRHAFANTLMYLDPDRKGFDDPALPVAFNGYGRSVIRNRGGVSGG